MGFDLKSIFDYPEENVSFNSDESKVIEDVEYNK